MSYSYKYSIKSRKDFYGDCNIFDKIIKDIGKGIQIIYGDTGTGKTSIINCIANEEKIDLLNINSSTKKSAKYIVKSIEDFLDNKSLFGKKGIFIDEIEFFLNENIGLSSILQSCNEFAAPIFIASHIKTISKLEKILPKNVFFYKIPNPSKEETKEICDNICSKEKIKIDPSELDTIIVNTYPDIRKLKNTLFSKEITNDMFEYDYTNNFYLLNSKTVNIKNKFLLGEKDLFIQIPIFHENYLNNCSLQEHEIAILLSESDVCQTYVYTNQSYDIQYNCVNLGIIKPSSLMKEIKNVKYGSILSKISNLKTKQKIFSELKSKKKIETIDQVNCLYEIGNVLSRTEKSKCKSILCL